MANSAEKPASKKKGKQKSVKDKQKGPAGRGGQASQNEASESDAEATSKASRGVVVVPTFTPEESKRESRTVANQWAISWAVENASGGYGPAYALNEAIVDEWSRYLKEVRIPHEKGEFDYTRFPAGDGADKLYGLLADLPMAEELKKMPKVKNTEQRNTEQRNTEQRALPVWQLQPPASQGNAKHNYTLISKVLKGYIFDNFIARCERYASIGKQLFSRDANSGPAVVNGTPTTVSIDDTVQSLTSEEKLIHNLTIGAPWTAESDDDICAGSAAADECGRVALYLEEPQMFSDTYELDKKTANQGTRTMTGAVNDIQKKLDNRIRYLKLKGSTELIANFRQQCERHNQQLTDSGVNAPVEFPDSEKSTGGSISLDIGGWLSNYMDETEGMVPHPGSGGNTGEAGIATLNSIYAQSERRAVTILGMVSLMDRWVDMVDSVRRHLCAILRKSCTVRFLPSTVAEENFQRWPTTLQELDAVKAELRLYAGSETQLRRASSRASSRKLTWSQCLHLAEYWYGREDMAAADGNCPEETPKERYAMGNRGQTNAKNKEELLRKMSTELMHGWNRLHETPKWPAEFSEKPRTLLDEITRVESWAKLIRTQLNSSGHQPPIPIHNPNDNRVRLYNFLQNRAGHNVLPGICLRRRLRSSDEVELTEL